ncbi:MAG: Ig-like domain-containing protein [Ardenticatenales bacterium]
MSTRPRTPRPPAAALARAVALAAILLGAAAACAPTPPPDQTPEPTEGPTISVTGACAGQQTIDPAAQAGPKDWGAIAMPEQTPCFRLTATDSGPRGTVGTGTAFVLESAEALKPADVAALLTITPALDVDVAKDKPVTAMGGQGDDDIDGHAGNPNIVHAQPLTSRYRITPKTALTPGTVYRIALKGTTRPDVPALRSWAFQTSAPLAVVHTLPADQSTFVPTDTGIELTFNQDGVRAEDVEAKFHIEPAVAGRFEAHRRSIVFVPTRLVTGTLYTVRVDAGVPGAAGAAGAASAAGEKTTEPTVFRFQTRRPEGGDTDPHDMPALEFHRPVWEVPTDEAPVIGLFQRVGEEFAITEANVQVLRYDSLDDFGAALARYQSMPRWADLGGERRLDTVGATDVFSFTAPLESQGGFGEIALRFPEPLEAGAYRLVVTVDGFPVPTGGWLQVTDVGAYTAVSEGKLIVWANDLASGKPLVGASVASDTGGAAGKTGTDGVAFVDTPAGALTVTDPGTDWARPGTTGTLTIKAADGRSTLVPLGDAFFTYGGTFRDGFMGRSNGNRHWRYIYTDRQLYRLSDTVHFWGIARERDGAPSVKSVDVLISGGDYTGLDYRPVAIAKTTVVPDKAGVFSGQLTFSGAAPGWYNLSARIGDETIVQTPLSIEDVVLPAYHLDVQTSRNALMAGEPFSATVTAAFFDGTPAAGIQVIASYDGADRTLSTGADGSATWSLTATPRPDAAWQGYASSFINVRAAAGEEGDIGANAQLSVFTGANAIQAEGVLTTGADDPISRTATVSGTVSTLDLTRLNGPVLTAPDDFVGAAVPGAAVTMSVTETEPVRVETGERYDFLSKRVVKTYRYDTVERAIGPFRATADANGRFRSTFAARSDRSYQAVVRVEDDQGRTTARNLWIGTLYLNDQADPLTIASEDDTSQGRTYRVGDTVRLRVDAGGEPFDGGRFLYLRARNGLQDYALAQEPRFDFRFEDRHIPDVHVLAAYFDGRTYRETTWGDDIRFDASERRLNVAVAPARASYGPGEKATVAVTVTNTAGEPVSGASVLISAVDAAILAAQGAIDRPDPLTSLYVSAPAGVLRTYTSHVVPSGAKGAEGGGGGGERSMFEDVALFANVTTDTRGRAESTFTLPDNLTSWVLTSLAATDALEAGSGFGIVPVRKPLFVDATFNRTYVTADRPEIRLRAFGTGLAEGGPVTYTLASDTLLPTPIDAAGDAFTATRIQLGALTPGTHRLRITARAGDLEDTLVREVTVLPSRLSHVVAETHVLHGGETADLTNAGDGAAEVVIADANRGGLYGDVATLADAGSDRLDEIVARAVAQDLLASAFGAPVAVPVDLRSTTYQTATGALSLFPYSAPDIALTADVALAAPERFGRQTMVQALRGALESAADATSRADGIVALRGLAALGEPVLADVAALLDAGPELDAPLTPTEQLDLGLAAALLGDTDRAEAAYRAVLTDHGQVRATTARVDAGADGDDVLAATARAALLGALVGDDLAPALHAYVNANPAKDISLAIWHAAYLKAALPRLATTPVKLRYTLPDGEQQATLDRGRTVVLHLTSAMRAALDLRVDDGAASVTVVRHEAFAAAGSAPGDADLALDRGYGGPESVPPPVGPDGATVVSRDATIITPQDAVGSVDATAAVTATAAVSASALAGAIVAVNEGDAVVITLTPRLGPKAVGGCYQVSDLLPSGLRPATARYLPGGFYGADEGITFPYAIEGQRVSFCAWPDEKGVVRPIRYLARAFAPGTYAAEPAILQAQSAPDRQALSAPATVEVRPFGAAAP